MPSRKVLSPDDLALLFYFMIASLGLSGCIGAVIKHSERIDFEAPQIDSVGTVRSGSSLAALSRSEVERIWGPPTRTRRVGDREERWTPPLERPSLAGWIW